MSARKSSFPLAGVTVVRRLSVPCFLFVAMAVPRPVGAQASEHLHERIVRRVYDGAPLSLTGAIDEALAHNASLVALRKQFEAARLRPAQERFLMPPTF